MNIAAAFTKAFQSFKGFLHKTDSFLQSHQAQIQGAAVAAAAIVQEVAPSAAPAAAKAVTLEEALMGEISAAFHTGSALIDSTNLTSTVTLSAELTGIVKHLADTLAGHPSVVAAKDAKA